MSEYTFIHFQFWVLLKHHHSILFKCASDMSHYIKFSTKEILLHRLRIMCIYICVRAGVHDRGIYLPRRVNTLMQTTDWTQWRLCWWTGPRRRAAQYVCLYQHRCACQFSCGERCLSIVLWNQPWIIKSFHNAPLTIHYMRGNRSSGGVGNTASMNTYLGEKDILRGVTKATFILPPASSSC